VIQPSVLKIFRGGRSTLNLWVSLRVLQQSNQLRTQSFATLGGNAVQSGQKKHHRRNSNCILSAFSCGSTVIGSTAAHQDREKFWLDSDDRGAVQAGVIGQKAARSLGRNLFVFCSDSAQIDEPRSARGGMTKKRRNISFGSN
jgi:hypothetical protein